MDVEERKLATIVFADLVGSTELGGSQDPERTRVLLERFYDAMAEEIERAGGTVEKFVGDAVMAVFGAPAALEDHAERALHAVLAMLRHFRAARRYARLHDELNSKLSTHHRVHGVAGVLEVEELLGAWDRVAQLQHRTEESVEANLSTPCVRNARSLFLCALARAYGGEAEESQRLEGRAEEASFEGFGLTLDGPRIRLALTRED